MLQNLSLEGLYLFGRPALGWLRLVFELKWRAICLIEDFRFGKDFFGKFCLLCLYVCYRSRVALADGLQTDYFKVLSKANSVDLVVCAFN